MPPNIYKMHFIYYIIQIKLKKKNKIKVILEIHFVSTNQIIIYFPLCIKFNAEVCPKCSFLGKHLFIIVHRYRQHKSWKNLIINLQKNIPKVRNLRIFQYLEYFVLSERNWINIMRFYKYKIFIFMRRSIKIKKLFFALDKFYI